MKDKITYTKLTKEEKTKVDRFLFLAQENGLQVGVSVDQTSVVLVNKNGDIEASMPITDFVKEQL